MKPIAIVDTLLLAGPSNLQTAASAITYFKRVEGWAACVGEASAWRVAIMSDAVEKLCTADLYPNLGSVTSIVNKFALWDLISPKDIVKAIGSLLSRAPTVSDLLGVETIDFDVFNSDPILTSDHGDKGLDKCSGNLLLTLCFASAQEQLLFASMHCIESTASIKVSGGTIMVRRGPAEDIIDSIEGTILSIGGPASLCDVVPSDHLWRFAETEIDLAYAIFVRSHEIIKSLGGDVDKRVAPFSVGRNFFHSVSQHEAGPQGKYSGTVLEACARLVINMPKNEINALERSDDHGNLIEYRNEKGKLAKRTHLTKHHSALRLMFWVDEKGKCEFANVENKSDLNILESDPVELQFF